VLDAHRRVRGPQLGQARLQGRPVHDGHGEHRRQHLAVDHQLGRLYEDMFGRPIDPIGLVAWGGMLDQDHGRAEVVVGICGSVEYRTRTVAGLYHALLGRPAEPEAMQAFVAFLGQCGTAAQVEALLLSSPEYFLNAGKGSNGGFLEAVYRDVFHRALDETGRALFGDALAAGADRAAIVAALFASSEYHQDWLRGIYSQYLHRAPDAIGLTAFLGALQQGASQEGVLTQVLTSEEFAAQP
jgi:hypothetical protein